MEARIFKQFQNLIYEKSGISMNSGKEALVSTRIGKRIKILGLSNQKEYLDYLNGNKGSEELVEFLNAISTNVTEFFRESIHFDFLNEALKKWEASGQTRFRIWSAACSSGEEPYSLAMTTYSLAHNPGVDLKILATDISTEVLQKALLGVYQIRDLEDIPPRFRLSHFFSKQDQSFEMTSVLKHMISFNRINLSTPPFPMKGPFDVIFCRNVMIYFDQAVREPLVRDMYRLLKPGGYLMIGHSETLTGLDVPFRAIQPSIYQRVLE